MNRKIFTIGFALAIGFGSVVTVSCKKDKIDESGIEAPVADKDINKKAIETYANIAFASYNESLELAQELKLKVEAFVAAPSETTHEAAKTAWINSREAYGQTEVFRFADGPIDSEALNGPEGLLNAWPLDENYIDYVVDAPTSGIVNDVTKTLENALLENLNEDGGEANISVGYHAVEFLLWGQDSTDPEANNRGAGQRAYTDYTTADNADRRGQYLKIVTDGIISNLQTLVDAWKVGDAANYRAKFLEQDEKKSLTQIITGMATLSKAELAVERMYVSLNEINQEHEHSCFSDNTHRDTYLNGKGVRNILLGEYTKKDGAKITGTGIYNAVKAKDATLAEALKTLSTEIEASLLAIPVPFDIAIQDQSESSPIKQSVLKLRDQGDQLVEASKKLGLDVAVEDSETAVN